MSEDCLNLNVFTPLNMHRKRNLAVMVWIHGGFFTVGSGAAVTYNAENIVSTANVIVVTMNYRLGALGFMVAGNRKEIAGNYGIRDQRLALKWVKKNIHRFGGNRNKVTLFGHSAGAQSVAIHMFTKKSRYLFDQAIIESIPASNVVKSPKAVKKQGEIITDLVKCPKNDIKCLKAKSPQAIVEAENVAGPGTNNFIDFFEPIGPHIDGNDITTSYIDAAKNGLFHNIPIIIGTNVDESAALIYSVFPAMKPLEVLIFELRFWRKCGVEARSYLDLLKQFECKEANAILKQYPIKSRLDVREEFSDIGKDFIYACPTRNIATNIARCGKQNVYVYVFNSSLPVRETMPFYGPCATRACHSAEVPYVFNSFDKLKMFGLDPKDSERALANQIIKYWTNFAKYGNPNGKNLVWWPEFRYNVDDQMYLLLKPSGSVVITDYRRTQCDFFDVLGYDNE